MNKARKTLFSKIFLTQAVVALTVIVLIIPTIFLLIGEYFLSAQKDDILQDASRVASLSEQVAKIREDETTLQLFKKGVEIAGRQSMAIVVNADGEIIVSPKNAQGVKLSRLDSKFISDVKDKESIIRLYPKGNIFSEQTIVAMVPIRRVDSITGKAEFMGAAIALRPMPQVRYIQNKIVAIIFIAQIIAWIVAFVVSFVLTRQITKPVKKMRTAAKSIASGNFNERIEITSNDEIGQLAESFNLMTQSLSELENMRTTFISDVSH